MPIEVNFCADDRKQTDRQTGILLKVFSFITFLERIHLKFGAIRNNVQTKPKFSMYKYIDNS